MPSRKLNILFYNTDLRGGGAERILVNIANNLAKNGHSVTVGTCFREGVFREDLLPGIKQFWAIGRPFKAYSKLALLFSPKFLFKKLIKAENYDVIVSFLEGFPSRIVSGGGHPKTVSWIHLELYPDTVTKEFRNLKEAENSYHSFQKIICVSETVKNCFKNCLPGTAEKLGVIYNPLEIAEIEEKSGNTSPYTEDGRIKLVTVGRLNPQKGYDRLLRIIKKLHTENIDFQLFILGSGPMENELKSYTEKNNLTKAVTFLGYQGNPFPYMKFADLFVCSSHKEGYSTVVTESVVLQTPVITTDCSGMAEILDNGAAGIITENNEEGLYEGLKNLLENKTLIADLKAKTIIRSEFLKNRNTYKEVEKMLLEL